MVLARIVEPGKGVTASTVLPHTKKGVGLAVVGLMFAMITFLANFSAAGALADGDGLASAKTLAWSFSLTTLAFGLAKIGIAVVLVGILVRIWFRLEAIKETMSKLRGGTSQAYKPGKDAETAFGAASVGTAKPSPLPIHKMARTMWAPMLAMGAIGTCGWHRYRFPMVWQHRH